MFTSTAVRFIILESVRVDQVAILRCRGNVQAHDVGLPQRVGERIASADEDDRRPVRFRQPSRLPADATGTDDRNGLAVETLAEHELHRERPLGASAKESISLDDSTEQRECQRDRLFSRRLREHVRSVRDHDPTCARGIEIDVVDPDAVVRDDPKTGPRTREELVVDLRRDQREDAVDIRRHIDEVESVGEGRKHPLGDLSRDVDPRPVDAVDGDGSSDLPGRRSER